MLKGGKGLHELVCVVAVRGLLELPETLIDGAQSPESSQEAPEVSSEQEKIAPAEKPKVLEEEVRSIKASMEVENLGNTVQSAIDNTDEFLNIEIIAESAPETTLLNPKIAGVTAEAEGVTA